MKKKKNQKWNSIWITILLLFSIVTPEAIANQGYNPTSIDSKMLEVYKERLLKYREEFTKRKIDSSINTKSNETIKVIVEFNEEPFAVKQNKAKNQNQVFQATKHKEKLALERTHFKSNLSNKGITAKEGRSFDQVLNGIVLEVKASDVPKLAEDPNVKTVYENSKQVVIPTLPADKNVPYMQDSSPFIGADQLWNLGYEGQGKKIGVIDTGIDYYHPDLKDAYKGGYDFVDNDADPYEGMNGTQQIDSTHGTHVSGTIAGRGTYANGGTRGIAPKSDLYVYRVLGPNGGWDEWVIAGIEKAVLDGMDVINLSLGNGINDPDQPTSRAVNNAMLAGVIAVVANGNAGNFGYTTVGAPATAALAISVGASYPPIKETIYKSKASATSEQQKEYILNWMMKWDPESTMLEALMDDKAIVYLGFGKVTDFEGEDLTGKIALVKRGESLLSEVNERAFKAGAEAVIIFNADGLNEHINHPFPQEGTIPMFDMRGDDGRELIENMEGKENNTFTFTAEEIDVYPGDEMASFSSKGPVIGSWDIKPDLVAPGVNIRSTVPGLNGTYENGYDRYSGTSMAAPHIAGLAALILEARPEMDVFDVKTALMNTSKKIVPLSGKLAYNVQEMGAGRVQAVQALETPVLAQVQETAYYTKNPFGETAEDGVQHKTGALNFGPVKSDETITKNIILKGLSESDTTYKVSYDLRWLSSLDENDVEPTSTNNNDEMAQILLEKQEVTVPAGGTINFNVSMNMPINSGDGVYEGFLYLSPLSGEGQALQLPFMGYKNPNLINSISYLESNPKFLSLNNDGIDESTNLDYKYLTHMQEAQLFLWSETNPNIYGLIKEFTGDDLKKGSHTYNWKGSFLSFNTGAEEVVPSGLYQLFIQGKDEFGNWSSYVIPYIVSNEITDIKVDHETIDQSSQKTILINENKIHGMITSAAVQIYRDFSFSVRDIYYWNMISMEYELYDPNKNLLSKGVIDPIKENGIPEKHMGYTLKDIFPNGKSRLVLRVKDKAGMVNEQSYQIQYIQDTGVELVGESEAVMNQEFGITLQSNQVKDMVGAEYSVTYPSKIFSVQRVEPVSGFLATTLSYVKMKTWEDETGTEYTTVKVVTDLRKNPKEHKKPKKDMIGSTGNIPTGRLVFVATDNLMDIGNYTIKAEESSYTNMNLEENTLKGTEKTIEVYTKWGTIAGRISPESLLDTNGQHRTDINYIKDGLQIEIYHSKNGYGSGGENRLHDTDGYRTFLDWSINTDGSLVIAGLNPKEKYDIAINYRSHFTSVVRGIQPVREDNGKLVAAYIEVDFGILKAGDVQNENDYAQKVDISDVANVARNIGKKAVDGSYDNIWTEINDLDKDGQINEKDLSYTIKNFDLKNSSQEGINIVTPEEIPPNEDSPTIEFNAENTTIKKGDIIPVKVELKNTHQVYAIQSGFTYNPAVLQLVSPDGTIATGGQHGNIFTRNFIDLKNKIVGNRIEFAASYKGDATSELKDTGVVMTYYFKVLDDSNDTSLIWDRSVLKILKEEGGMVYPEWQKATKNITFQKN